MKAACAIEHLLTAAVPSDPPGGTICNDLPAMYNRRFYTIFPSIFVNRILFCTTNLWSLFLPKKTEQLSCWLHHEVVNQQRRKVVFFNLVHPASDSWVKWSGREDNHSYPRNAELYEWSYTSTSTYVFMEWCLIQHRDFILPFKVNATRLISQIRKDLKVFVTSFVSASNNFQTTCS